MQEQYSEFVSVKEACEVLGVCRASLDNYARAGKRTRFEQGARLYDQNQLSAH